MGNRRWTPAEDAVLRAKWHTLTIAELSAQLDRTQTAMERRAFLLGLHARQAPGLYTFAEVARALGVSKQTAIMYARRGLIRTVGQRYQKFVTVAELERVVTRLRRREPGAGTLTTAEVARRLGYSGATVMRLAQFGVLRAVKLRGAWCIDPAGVADLERRLRATGAARMRWADLLPEVAPAYARRLARLRKARADRRVSRA